MNLGSFPIELQNYIFTFLGSGDLCSAGQVCKTWRALLKDEKIWKVVSYSLMKPDHPSRGFSTIFVNTIPVDSKTSAIVNYLFEKLQNCRVRNIKFNESEKNSPVVSIQEWRLKTEQRLIIIYQNGMVGYDNLNEPTKVVKFRLINFSISWCSPSSRTGTVLFVTSEDPYLLKANPPKQIQKKHDNPIVYAVPFFLKNQQSKEIKFDYFFASGDKAGNIHIWDDDIQFKWVTQLSSEQTSLTTLCIAKKFNFFYDTYLISGDTEGNLWIWNFTKTSQADLAKIIPEKIPKAHSNSVSHLKYGSPDVVISAGKDGKVKAWDLKNKIEISSTTIEYQITSLEITFSHAIIGTESGDVLIWDWSANKITGKERFYIQPVSALYTETRPPIVAIGYQDGYSQILDFSPPPVKDTSINPINKTQTVSVSLREKIALKFPILKWPIRILYGFYRLSRFLLHFVFFNFISIKNKLKPR